MKKRKLDWLLVIQCVIILWGVLFLFSIFVVENGELAGALAIGNVAGLFVSIPLAVICLVARAKGRISDQYVWLALAFSVLNILIGVADWYFAIMVMRMP